MAGRTPRDAVKAYLEALQKTLSTVCQGVLRVSNYDGLIDVGVLALEEAVPLNGRPDLYFSVTEQYRIVKDLENGTYRVTYRVTTCYYAYKVETQDGQEVVGYHWHPEGVSPVKFAHLHIGPAANIAMEELSRKAHFPTGQVALEEVIEFIIRTFRVEPDRTASKGLSGRTKSLFIKRKRR